MSPFVIPYSSFDVIQIFRTVQEPVCLVMGYRGVRTNQEKEHRYQHFGEALVTETHCHHRMFSGIMSLSVSICVLPLIIISTFYLYAAISLASLHGFVLSVDVWQGEPCIQL